MYSCNGINDIHNNVYRLCCTIEAINFTTTHQAMIQFHLKLDMCIDFLDRQHVAWG